MQPNKLKDAYVELCQRYAPNYYITLATNQPLDAEWMKSLLKRFAQDLDTQALGRKWFKKPTPMRVDGVCFIEKPNANLHAHCVLHVPYDLPDVAAAWTRLCPSGSVNVQEIYTDNFGAYCAKEMELRRFDSDQIALLSDFMSPTSRAASNTSLR